MLSNEYSILPVAYFPPVSYFSRFFKNKQILIEQFENYTKQTYRNRCNILAANGVLPLNIPVLKSNTLKQQIRDVKIDNTSGWQKIHFRSILSAYKNSPFFDYYWPDLENIIQKENIFLFDLDLELTDKILSLSGIEKNYKLTNDFIPVTDSHSFDYRNKIHPKKNFIDFDPEFNPKPYIQVFSEKFQFIPDLSILDVLFNLGPDTKHYLNQ